MKFVIFITLPNAQNSVHSFSGRYRNLVCSAQFFAEYPGKYSHNIPSFIRLWPAVAWNLTLLKDILCAHVLKDENSLTVL